MTMKIEKDVEWMSHDGSTTPVNELSEYHMRAIIRKLIKRLHEDDKETSFLLFHHWLNKKK